jgi:two-component system chemotaxis sensor kinase CheA
VVIVSIGNQRVGLVVEQVNGQEEVVIKPLGIMLQKVEGYAGATITGNGSIALILDLPGLVERFE